MTVVDTTSQEYRNLLGGVGRLRSLLAPRFKLFVKLPRPKQREWLQRDPLLKEVIRLVRDVDKLDVDSSEASWGSKAKTVQV